jgi:hypothetical protein
VYQVRSCNQEAKIHLPEVQGAKDEMTSKTAPEWTTVKLPLEKLIEWQYNPVQLSKEDAKQIEISVRKFGLVEPLVANAPLKDGTRRLLDGHQRKQILIYSTLNTMNLSEKLHRNPGTGYCGFPYMKDLPNFPLPQWQNSYMVLRFHSGLLLKLSYTNSADVQIVQILSFMPPSS